MRLKIRNLNRIINEYLTDSELSLYIYIVQHADLKAILMNLKMREATATCDFCKQTFYNTLYSLQKKGYLMIQKNREVDYDILLIDNQFKNEKDTTDPYMNLNFDFLEAKEFYNLPKNTKRILLRLMSMKDKRMKMTKDTLKTYKIFYELDQLKKYITITQKANGTYILSLNYKYRNKNKNLFFNINIL